MFLQMFQSPSADHTHVWRIEAVRLHTLMRNMSTHGRDTNPPASEPRIQMWRPIDPHGAYHDGTLQMYKVTAVSEGTCSNEGAQILYDKASGVVGTNPPDPAPFSYNTAPTIFRCS